MWNQAAASKIVQDRLNLESYERHRRSLQNVRSKLNTSSPSRPHFVFNKYKRRLSEDQRNFEIKSQNAILVQKMISQKMGSYHKLSNPVFGKQSLNEIIARKRNSQIAQDNKIIIRKLTDSKPFYNTRNILLDTDRYLCYMSNISQNARRAPSTTMTALDSSTARQVTASSTRLSESRRYHSAGRLRLRAQSFF